MSYNSLSTGQQVENRLKQGYYDDILSAGVQESVLQESMTKDEFDVQLARSMSRSDMAPFVLDLDKLVYIQEDGAYKVYPLIGISLLPSITKEYTYQNPYKERQSAFCSFDQDGNQTQLEDLDLLPNPITKDYAESIVKAVLDNRPFYGKSVYDINPSWVTNGSNSDSFDERSRDVFPICVKVQNNSIHYTNSNDFHAELEITIYPYIGSLNRSLGVINQRATLRLMLYSSESGFRYNVKNQIRSSVSTEIEISNSPSVNGLLAVFKDSIISDLSIYQKGDTLTVGDQVIKIMKSSYEGGYDYHNGNIFYGSWASYKMIHFDMDTKDFVYVPLSMSTQLSNDESKIQSATFDFTLGNIRYHMVFALQEDQLVLMSKYTYDNSMAPYILDLDKFAKTENGYNDILSALTTWYKNNSVFDNAAFQPTEKSSFLEERPNDEFRLYTQQDALDLYNAIIQHRPIFGKYGYGKNPADPRLVKAPDVFPLSYNIYNESNDFNYVNDNNFNFTVNFFIDYPFGGNNPSLGVNAWGVFPFGLRFMKTPAYDMVYILNAGTRNPSVYADMVDIPKLKQFNNNISINFNPLSIQQGDSMSIQLSSTKWEKILTAYNAAIDAGIVYYFDKINFSYNDGPNGLHIPYSFKMETSDGEDGHKIMSGVTIEYTYQGKINVLKFVQNPDNPHDDYHLNFKLESRTVYEIPSRKEIPSSVVSYQNLDIFGNYPPEVLMDMKKKSRDGIGDTENGDLIFQRLISYMIEDGGSEYQMKVQLTTSGTYFTAYLDIHKEDSQTGKRYRVIVYDPLRKPNCPTVNIVCDYDISSDTFQSIHFESHNFSSKTINIDVDSYSLHFDDLFDFNHLTMQQGSEISIDSESIVNERKSVIVELSNQSDQDMTLKFNNIPIKISSQEGERDIFFRILNIPGTSTLFIERIYTTQLSVDKN